MLIRFLAKRSMEDEYLSHTPSPRKPLWTEPRNPLYKTQFAIFQKSIL